MLLALSLLLSCDSPPPEPTPPGEVQAGFARARIPAPVGIGTAGFGPFNAPTSSSPFAEIYPATTRVHGHPEIKVLAISRGEGHEVIFIRLDAVGMFQQLRRALVVELQERTGRDLDDALIVGATHTHSGPGRIIDGGGVYDIIADRFFPEFYDQLLNALADAVEAALADLQPARVGGVVADGSAGHSDRRCEDGEDYTNGDLPLLAVEQDGQLRAVLMAYAIHGTALDIDQLTLSQDVSGAIEQAVEDRFDHPVEVMEFNSWGADMSPADPEVPLQEGAAQPEGYDRMERVGAAVADAVHLSLDDIEWWDDPVIDLETHRLFIDREVIGYESDIFPYDWGGVYCAGTEESDCDPATYVPELDKGCVPFNEETPAPNQSVISAGRVGGFHLVTFPGEPGTLLAEELTRRMMALDPSMTDVLFLGYTQDYLGYALLEDDWWQGGYEASGSLWGPRQGEHLVNEAERIVADALDLERSVPLEPLPILAFADPEYTPRPAETPVSPGQILQQVPAQLSPTEVLHFTFNGHDPWLGTPLVTLSTAAGEPVLRPNGVPVNSDGYHFWIDLTPEPSYSDEPNASERAFRWTVSMPGRHAVDQGLNLEGDYTLQVQLPDGSTLESDVFTVLGG